MNRRTMNRRLLTTTMALGATAALGLSACSKDDTAAAASTTSPVAEKAAATGTAQFCDAVLAGNELFSSQDQPDPAEAAKVLEDLTASSPSALEADVENIVEETQTMFGPDGGPPSQEYLGWLNDVQGWMVDNCGWNIITVDAHEYEFSGLPEQAEAGKTVLTLDNKGEQVHAVDIVRVNDGVTESVDELLAMPEDQVGSKMTHLGGTLALPGQTGYQAVDLEPGRYAVVCFVPDGTTAENVDQMMGETQGQEGGQPHAMLGMTGEFTVS